MAGLDLSSQANAVTFLRSVWMHSEYEEQRACAQKGETDVLSHINMHDRAGPIPHSINWHN